MVSGLKNIKWKWLVQKMIIFNGSPEIITIFHGLHMCACYELEFSLKATVALVISCQIFLILLLSVKVVTVVFYAHLK